MESESRLWKLNDRDQWELYNHVEALDAQPLASKKNKESESTEKEGTKTQKPSSQVFYLTKTKQEVKGSLIYTPKGYGIIQNIMPEKNMITVKVNNEIIDFERSEVANEIMIEFIYAEMGGKRSERIAFPIQSSAKEIAERITSQNEDPTLMSRLFFKGKELPLSNDNLEKLGIDPTSKILVLTKLGKFYSANRFKQVLTGWSYGTHTMEAIAFSVNKDVRVAGIGLYGPSQMHITLFGTVKLAQGENPDGVEPAASVEVEMKYLLDPNEKIQKVMFDKPVLIKGGEVWSAIAEIQNKSTNGGFAFGGCSHYGNMGNATVIGEGDVTFTFKTCMSSGTKMNQTSVYSGQIPEIYYYI